MPSNSDYCLIFDLDGTLVDSEELCNQAFLDLLPRIPDTVEKLVVRYRGLKLSTILTDIENRHSIQLPEDFVSQYRGHVSVLFDEHLKPADGVVEMLERSKIPRCVASSGPLEKIRHSLEVTGLIEHFGEKVFSSYEIQSWKPEPGLFLYAAVQMECPAAQCIVIEDSEVGLVAAKAAGMKSLHYRPNCGSLRESEFSHMSQLNSLLP